MSKAASASHGPWITVERGIRKYEHLTRKYRQRPDVYYSLRYKVDGKSYENGLGWASEGFTLENARLTLAELRIAKKTGTGAVTLQEKRAKAEAEREAEREKPTIARLWEIYQETKGQYSRLATDRSNFRHFASIQHRLPETLRTHEIKAIEKGIQADGKASQTIKNNLGGLLTLV